MIILENFKKIVNSKEYKIYLQDYPYTTPRSKLLIPWDFSVHMYIRVHACICIYIYIYVHTLKTVSKQMF